MNPSARSALTLAVLLVLPQLQALCPRLAPDVISGKVIPCRYLCIKINFLELPSIILSTERDGVLCSTLLLRRRGVCKNGGCIPFGSDDDIKPKGALGKVIAAIDKFASGSYRQKAPKPGTPFGPIVSTATSLFGGGSSTTSGGTSSAASSIVATATAAAVGSSLKKLFSERTSASSENKRRNKQPALNPFGPSLSSIHKPDHPANAPGGTLPSSSGAVAVSFGGGPPVLPPSTEGAAEHEGTHASPGTPSTNSGSTSAHPALMPFNNPPPPKQDVSNSAGGAITKAIGIVWGNIREMSGTPTHGIPSGQQTSGGPVVASKRHFDSSVRDFPKPTGVAQNGHIREATAGSGATPTAFPVGGIPPIVQPSSSSGTESGGKERFGVAPVAPAVTDFGYKSKPLPIASSPSRLPSIETQVPGAASRAGSSTGIQLNSPYGEALARLREISQGSTRSTLPGQPLSASFGEASVPSRRSSIITLHKGTSGHEVHHNKETVKNVPSTGATPITAGFGRGSPTDSPSTAVVFERKRKEASRWSEAPRTASRPLKTATEAAEVPSGTLVATSNPVSMMPPSKRTPPLKPPPTSASDSSSGSLITLQTLKQATRISVRQPLSPVPGSTSIPTNSPIEISHKGANESEVKPSNEPAVRPLNEQRAPAAVELGGGPPLIPPSTVTAAENKGPEGSKPSTAPSIILGPAVIAGETARANITHIEGPSAISTNKPNDRPSPSIGRSGLEVSAASGSRGETTSRLERIPVRALNTLRRGSGSTRPVIFLRKAPSALTDNTSKPRRGSPIQNLHKGVNHEEVKHPEEKAAGALEGNTTRPAVGLGGGPQSVAPSTMAQTGSENGEASRLSAAPSGKSRMEITVVKPAEERVTNVRRPSEISTNSHEIEPSPAIGSIGLGLVAASKSTEVRSRIKNTFGGVLNTLRRVSGSMIRTSPFRQPLPHPAVETPKPSDSSIQSIQKGASNLQVKHRKNTISGVPKGSPKLSNQPLGNGTPPIPPPIMGSTNIKPARTSPSSAAQNSALRPANAAAAASRAGATNMKNISQAPTNKPVNGPPLSPPEKTALAFPSASLLSSASGKTVEKTLGGALSTLQRISKKSPPLTPSKKLSSVLLSEKLKPFRLNKGANRSQKGYTEVEKTVTLHGSASTIPAATADIASVKRGPAEIAQKPAAPAISAMVGTVEPSISRVGVPPQLPSSTPVNRLFPSRETAPVGPAMSSRTASALESPPQKSQATGTTPSLKEALSEGDAGKSKQSKDSQAHSSHSAATARKTETSLNISGSPLSLTDAALHNRAPLLGGGETAVKTTISLPLSLSKNTVPKQLQGNKKATPPPLPQNNTPSRQIESSTLPINSGRPSELRSLPATKKGTVSKPSNSGSESSSLRQPTSIISYFLHRSKTKRQKLQRGSKLTHNQDIKESVASSSRDLDSTKSKLRALLNSGITRSTLSGPPAGVQHTMPKLLPTPSQSNERSNSPIGSKSQATKPAEVETMTPNKAFTNELAAIKGTLSLKRKESATRTYNKKGSSENSVAPVTSSSHGGGEAKVVDGRNVVSNDKLKFSNLVSPTSELGSASGQVVSGPSSTPISPINPGLPIAVVQGSKQGLALGHKKENKIAPTVPSGLGTTNRSPNNGRSIESVNKSSVNGPSTITSSGREPTGNVLSPGSKVPPTQTSASSATVTLTKNASPGISSISQGNTVATPSKPIATPGAAFRARSRNQLAPKPISTQANRAPVVAAAPKNKNSSQSSNQGSVTSVPMDKRDNAHSTGDTLNAKVSTSSQSTSSSSGRVESEMSSRKDNPSRSVSTSTLDSEKRSFTSTAQPIAIPALVQTALGAKSASSVPAGNTANRRTGTSETTVTTEKHTHKAGSLSSRKESVSLGPAAQGVETPMPSSLKPTNTVDNVSQSSTSVTQAGLVAKTTSGLPAPNLEAPGATSGSTRSVPSTAAASRTESRNPSPETLQKEITKAENATTPGLPSNLAASAPGSSAPQNVQASKLLAATTAKRIVQNARASAPRLDSKADVLEVNASTNAKTPGGSAISLENAVTNSKGITEPGVSLPGEKIISSSLATLKKALKQPAKPSGIIRRLGSVLSGPRDALELKVQSGKSAVPNLKSEAAANNGKSAVTEAKPKTAAHDLTQPAASEEQPSQPTSAASGDIQGTPTFNIEQPTPPLYARMQSPGGIVFGRHPTMAGGFWGPGQGLPGMFRPF